MNKLIQAVLSSDEKTALHQLITALSRSGKRYFLRNEILQAFTEHCDRPEQIGHSYHGSSLSQLIHYTHEIILDENYIWLLLRPWIASQQAWRLTVDLSEGIEMTPQALLNARDRQVNRSQPHILTLDFSAFDPAFPAIDDPRNIGQGLDFLNRYLCNKLLTEPQYWVEALFNALHVLEHDGRQLLINERIHSGVELSQQVKQTLKFLGESAADAPYASIHPDLQAQGFEPGWGNTIARVRETLELLNRLIDDPEPAILEAFVSRIPAVFRVVLISIHGWMGQESVLGRPETRSQVAYVLEQATSLEHQLRLEVQQAGLDLLGICPQVIVLTRLIPNCTGTQCGLPFEPIEGTENAWILRVPFREFNPKVTQNWISKFEIWPYLESFTDDAERELLAKLGGRPDLIIGNYSDGNLVASLLARRFGSTQCNIAHSLEKPKYLFSNLYWQDMEAQYHFSAQFTADLIGMNAADFIITASNQEIVGTPESMGQYESYKCFTMPNLYHVIDGINLFNPKFNRVPPSVNEQIFFPYSQRDRRDVETSSRIEELIFSGEDPRIFGHLDNPNKRPILAVDPISLSKNLAGLAECFGQSTDLQAQCNLIFLTNVMFEAEDVNPEEAQAIAQLKDAIDRYHLHGKIRWLGLFLPNRDVGEMYRIIADRRGIFVHFALFEAFGRTILEAMSSGLPTFATQFGGALEIIEEGKHGFHINPTDLEGTSEKILHFLDRCDAQPQVWQDISDQAIQRIHEQYNWQKHTQRLLQLTKIYSFWNCTNSDRREVLHHYLEVLFYLLYKPRADGILAEHMQR
ncbi:Sucrose synthase [Tumidithrix helvetica PCC 7403]|uniref:sucrose synthase n=1 Tax=Tumidithrix helvetica TaxID=3457545 RepID=UPI003CAD027D